LILNKIGSNLDIFKRLVSLVDTDRIRIHSVNCQNIFYWSYNVPGMKISHTFLLFIKGAFSSFCKLSKLFQIFMSPTTIVVYKIINRCNAKRLNNMESSVVVVIFCETTRIAYIKYKIPSTLYDHKWPSGQSSRLLLQYSSCQRFYPCWGFNQNLIFNLCLVIHWGPWRFPYMHVIKTIIILWPKQQR